ncbi:MAG: tRNA (adenosine(37)-N6)-threonylcarbamoyltransferase complex dimerization subunit type 1 TsaB [Pseudomonadota bacterium]
MTRYLAVDTATEACSVALWQDGRTLEHYEVVGRGHTARLLPMLHAVLAEAQCTPAQLDGFVCGVGPGSFAGVRIGVGLIKGMALALDKPVVPALSLTSLAQRAIRLQGASQVVAVIDARMNEVYCATFVLDSDRRAQLQDAPQVCAPEAVPGLSAGDWHAVGSGWNPYETKLRTALNGAVSSVDAEALPHAEDALHWAQAEWSACRFVSADNLEPVYLRDKVALTVSEQHAKRALA